MQLKYFYFFLQLQIIIIIFALNNKSIIMELIGRKIKEKRKERKLTQDELGKKIGACYVSICNLEKGRNVTTHLLRDACNELGLELIVVEK